jgi:hypothetical protein
LALVLGWASQGIRFFFESKNETSWNCRKEGGGRKPLNELNEQTIIKSHRAIGEDLDQDRFPQLGTISPAFFYQFVPVAKAPGRPEVAFVPTTDAKRHELVGVLSNWNFLWEAVQYRKEAFREDRFAAELPELASWIDRLPQANTYLIADSTSKYDAYAPLYHVLPKVSLDRYNLPALKRPLWPNNAVGWWHERLLPFDFTQRLSRAFGEHVWRYFDSGSGLRAFSSTEHLTLLSHSLDFWLPYALLEGRMREFDRVEPETPKQRKLLASARRENDPDVAIERPGWEGLCGLVKMKRHKSRRRS